MKKKILLFLYFLIISAFFAQECLAQQTIISVPSSEILPLGGVIFKESNRFNPMSDGFATIAPSFTFGTGYGTEISTGVATTLDGNTLVRGDISAKKVWFLGASTRLTAGATVSPYLNRKEVPGAFTFAHLSHRIKETKTSITAGGYVGSRSGFADNGGVLLGIEQVIISNKLRVALDWMSGDNSNGRLGVGLKYRPIPTLSVTSAVIIPNKQSDDIAFNISI